MRCGTVRTVRGRARSTSTWPEASSVRRVFKKRIVPERIHGDSIVCRIGRRPAVGREREEDAAGDRGSKTAPSVRGRVSPKCPVRSVFDMAGRTETTASPRGLPRYFRGNML